ncbi:MAG: hypothetical protein FWC51_03705 [Proteobacteria bacterium]|nr:hypothetical protein [Pseudomonadota bacterium]
MRVISVDDALSLGLDTVHVFRFTGFGDAIMFAAAARELVRQTGKPVLLGMRTKNYGLLSGIDDNLPAPIYFLDGYYSQIVNKKSVRNLKRRGMRVNYFGQSKRVKNWIIREVAVGMGLSGRANLTPYLRIDDDLKDFGRLTERPQIAIMTGGKKIKAMPDWLLQDIVDHFKDRYDFVQIGAENDHLLRGALDMRGQKLSFFRQVPAVLKKSDLFVGSEGGQMHMAAAVRTRAVIGDALNRNYTGTAGHIHIFPERDKPYDCFFPGDMETLDPRKFYDAIETQMSLAGTPVPDNDDPYDLTGIEADRHKIRRDSLIVNFIDLGRYAVRAIWRGKKPLLDKWDQVKCKIKYGINL